MHTRSAEIHKPVSWAEFIQSVRSGPIRTHASGGQSYPFEVLYRGHARPDWHLWSPLDRRLTTLVRRSDGELEYWSARKTKGLAWYDTLCSEILDHFRQGCRGVGGIDPGTTDDEYWALGRHFGLLTPLLDWTLSPYVAAFFAFAERLRDMEHGSGAYTVKGNEGSVRVWALSMGEQIEVPGEFEVVRAHPRAAVRQRAQSGLFTRLRSEEYLEVVPYFASRGLTDYLVAFDIPLDAASHAMRDLQLMNITPATLFPDLYGAAWQANVDNAKINFASLVYDWDPARADPGPSLGV